MRSTKLLMAGLAFTLVGCHQRPDASPEPMGDPVELGGPCDEPPVATEPMPGGIAENIVGVDQYGREVDLYRDLCDKKVLILRAGFD